MQETTRSSGEIKSLGMVSQIGNGEVANNLHALAFVAIYHIR